MTDFDSLAGMSAGKISFTNFDVSDHLLEQIIDAAAQVWENMKSAWTLDDFWEDGTTIWLSPDGSQQLTVTPAGEFHIADRDPFDD